MKKDIRSVLVIGSGGLSIGQAGEFDYSGTQAVKALKEEGIRVVLVNPNIATIQTSEDLADTVYFLPLSHSFLSRVIKKEQPDGILATFGGQVALNSAVSLHQRGTLARYGTRVLGTPIASIMDTEDRGRFVRKLKEIGVLTPRSKAVSSLAAAQRAAQAIGFPIMIRGAYALGGEGSRPIASEKELDDAVRIALASSPQILIEEYLEGWKEIEYEVMRDQYDNCITICNMENMDPLGIHTGESVVVTPSQTLTNEEYHFLREISIRTIRHLGIVGECNIQFALNPNKTLDYRVIEVNARLSRSSALASKASGYPIAFIAAKLALGYSLADLPNRITQKTSACFEPALDYIVVKMPRWDLNKFQGVAREVGSEMKSVGEVMAIGRTFEEVIQKACRMINTGMKGLIGNTISFPQSLAHELQRPTDRRIFAIAEALRSGMPVSRVARLTHIDPWFISAINNITTTARRLSAEPLSRNLLLTAKRQGFSDAQIASLSGSAESAVASLRKRFRIFPARKQIDTLAAEYPAQTNYNYLTYNASQDDAPASANRRKKILVLGSGPYSIGSSVEFDWCAVSAGKTLQEEGYECIMINSNPETVSTDYDVFHTLYFEELSKESVLEIVRKEKPEGVIISMGGQIPNTLALPLKQAGVRIIGTDPNSIDQAEDRHKFSKLLDRLDVDQPAWKEVTSLRAVKQFARTVGFPVIVRPSYVLSGSAMRVASTMEQLERYLSRASEISPDHPVVISKFITGAKEIEMDAVAYKGEVVAYAISEHIENAGVHSGDATLVFPAQKLYIETIRRIKRITRRIAHALAITGPFNIQYLAKDNEIKVIECNVRASRTFPFVSKVLRKNLISFATRAMISRTPPRRLSKSVFDLDYVGVKAPQFSFTRLRGADPLLGVEMMSTGEVACLDTNVGSAFLKALKAADPNLPLSAHQLFVCLAGMCGAKTEKLLPCITELQQRGVRFFSLPHVWEWLKRNGITTRKIFPPSSRRTPSFSSLLYRKTFSLVVAFSDEDASVDKQFIDHYRIRRMAVDHRVSLITNINCAVAYFDALLENAGDECEILPLDAYKAEG